MYVTSASYHPTSNGFVEHTVLYCVVDLLVTPQSITGYSTSGLLLGHRPRSRLDLLNQIYINCHMCGIPTSKIQSVPWTTMQEVV